MELVVNEECICITRLIMIDQGTLSGMLPNKFVIFFIFHVYTITKISDFPPISSKEFLDIQATIECGFTLKRVRDMTRTYSQMHRTDSLYPAFILKAILFLSLLM